MRLLFEIAGILIGCFVYFIGVVLVAKWLARCGEMTERVYRDGK